ncbi:c-type cytochrome [soil metagenome]
MNRNKTVLSVLFATLLVAGGMQYQAASFAAVAEPSKAPVAAADPALIEAGTQTFITNCAECHSIGKDGADAVGPNLWGVIGRKAGSKADFAYSDALKASPVVWDAQTLDKWLESPANFIPDNMMPFIGIKDAGERAALIAFIMQRSSQE